MGHTSWLGRFVLAPLGLLVVVMVLVLASSAGAQSTTESALDWHRARLQQAEHDFSRGAYQDGFEAATSALSRAEADGDPFRIATARLVRANLLLALGESGPAARDLESVIEAEASLDAPALVLSARLNLANVRVFEGDRAAALGLYQAVFEGATELGDAEMAARALANGVRVEVDGGVSVDPERLAGARAAIAGLPASSDKALLEIHLAESQLRAIQAGLGDRAALMAGASSLLRDALELADGLADADASPRIRAQALGHLGALYAADGQLEEALALTRRALLQASRNEVDTERFFWHRQSARLHARMGMREKAIEDYAATLDVLAAHRSAIARSLRMSADASEQSADLSSLYREYVDLLLRRAREAQTADAKRADLLAAQTTLEQLKGDELRDYFEDDCVIRYREKMTSIQSVSYDAVVVYPFLLDDRLELLVSVGGKLEQVVVDVSREDVRREVAQLRSLLEKRTTRQYLRPAAKLHAWLIDPIEPVLERADPATLVFVPDGILRTVPMAALYDGERFLIERYALGLTPGLELTDPQPFGDRERLALVAGISDGVEGFAPLPNVEREVDSVHSIMGGDVLLNVGFSRESLTDRIREKKFGLIHIASHAQFESEAASGFVLTHDGRLSFDALADAVGTTRYREDPLDLVILSACETAQGDEQAALGLSGVAVKAGARSALGTLWQVSDEATTEFMIRFYESLSESGTSRAQAVRQAQLRLLRDPLYQHPYYWSAFLLINSWL